MYQTAFFLGKGGVGKTTLSSAFALELARQGKKVLVASLDPAHNLGDVLGLSLGTEPKMVEENLWALEIDMAWWVDKYLADSRQEMERLYSYNNALNTDSFFSIMKYSPGTEEYAVLWAIEYIHCELAANYDFVVFDTPPTALTLRFLAMPTVSMRWLAELSKLRERILSKRQSISRVNADSTIVAGCIDKEDDTVYGKLGGLKQRMSLLYGLFSNESYIATVINQDQLSVSEALRIKKEFEPLKIDISAICVNKRGMSELPWELDSKLANTRTFGFEFLSKGLSTRDDLTRLGAKDIVNDFLLNKKRGKA